MSKAGASLATCYGPVSADVIAKAENIRLLILDVDGVLSDGLIYMGNNGEELKAFNVRDGYGIRCALTSDIQFSPENGRGEGGKEEDRSGGDFFRKFLRAGVSPVIKKVQR